MFKKFLLIVLSILPIFFFASTSIHAQDTMEDLNQIYCQRRTGNQLNLETWYGGRCNPDNVEESIGFGDIILLDLYSKIAGETDTGNTAYIQGIIDMLKKLIDGEGSQSSIPQPNITANNNGALNSTASLITKIYQNPPASSIDYITNVKENLQDRKIIKPAYAQNSGYGFKSFSPIIPVWKAFRDMAYLIFIIAFIFYGFMIMFRMKINPQTVMNIQLALPKLIITLLLITFSYAIAGFLIDLFYVITGFIFSVFAAGGIVKNLSSARSISGFSLGITIPFFVAFMHITIGGLIPKLITAFLPIPNFVATTLSYATSGLSLILGLILIIAILYTFIKIVWMLLKSYVTILLQIIFSPIILLGNIIPGSQSFNQWIKGIFAELSIFATIMFMFILAFYFIGPPRIWGLPVGEWLGFPGISSDIDLSLLPPLDGQLTDWGDLWGVDSSGKFAMVGLGLLLVTPSIAKSIRDALKVKEAGYGSTIGAALGLGFSSVTALPKYGLNVAKGEMTAGLGNAFSDKFNIYGRGTSKGGSNPTKDSTPSSPKVSTS
jgi:hypothetical protein